MIICIILVTPLVLVQKLTPLLDALQKSFKGSSFAEYLV
jgi:hypothetical protein